MAKPISTEISHRVNQKQNAEVHSLLQNLIEKRKQEIFEIEQMVERYERKVRMEEQAYRKMSALRRMLTGKKPDHHIAVEYIHYVKNPMEKVRLLREELEQYQERLNGFEPNAREKK
ncbi:hypothetical protein [Paenibacillus sp. HB172176]|uniref:hypothetical protein n=1 Tax=Paenibacillus sp. HB172176 TaxID=2493690 RepID=UPI00143A7914|nr:hypothetical protein [Paenibacillus sp. HB172176]